jgi:DNA-directed RNA polymerase beta subunit
VLFEHDKGKTHASGKRIYSARVIPYRGSWLDFEFDHKDILYVRIDRRRKLYATVLLRALGYTTEDLLNYYYDVETIRLEPQAEGVVKAFRSVNFDLLEGQRTTDDIIHPVTGQLVLHRNRKFNSRIIKIMRDAGLTELEVPIKELEGKVFAADIVDEETGEVLYEANQVLEAPEIDHLVERKILKFDVLFVDRLNRGRAEAQAHAHDRAGHRGHLPPPAPGRPAVDQPGAQLLQQPVLQRAALRSVGRRPHEGRVQVRPSQGADCAEEAGTCPARDRLDAPRPFV